MACLVVAWGVAALPAAEEIERTITIELDRGVDLGRSTGSLFELRSEAGRPLLGAGFLGAYNTLDRSDGHVLHVFEANDAKPEFRALPRVNTDAGVYLFDRAGKLYARSSGGKQDANIYEYDAQNDRWDRADGVLPEATWVAGGLLEITTQAVVHKGRTILDWPKADGRLARPYYAQGRLFLWNTFDAEDPRVERYLSWEWTPDRAEPLVPDQALELPLQKKREFPYAVGQWHDDVLLTTNLGGVYRFRDGRWTQLRKHDGKSYQVYASLNVDDALWLAQYPSGQVWRYEGEAIEEIADHPPVPPGVSRSSREAQSLTIFAGDVYTGVWPWGELWRFEPGANEWTFLRRMFSQPEITNATTHPYETETGARESVANIWGQRVTSLVPLGDSLFISTSAKNSRPWDPSFDFLDEHARNEYGLVYQMRKPGHVAAPLRWTDGPTTIQIEFTADAIRVLQDGELIGRASRAAKADRPDAHTIDRAESVLNTGIYGPRITKSNSVHITTHKPQSPSEPLQGVYLHMDRLLRDRPSAEAGRKIIAETLDRCLSVGVSTIMPFITTSSGVAAFPSKIATRSLVADWDPLAVVMEEANSRGMKVEPVLCMMVSGYKEPAGILKEHPEWALRDSTGEPFGYLSPANPEARAWLVSLVAEVVQNYQPEALWFDYLRYPNQEIQLDPTGQADLNVRLAEVADDQKVEVTQQFREDALTKLAETLSDVCRAAKPGIQLGIYSWGPHVATGHKIAQNWPRWVDQGFIDRVNVSGYCYRDNYGDRFMQVFVDRLSGVLELNRNQSRQAKISFALGLETSHGSVRQVEEIQRYRDAAAMLDVNGFSYFSFTSLDPFIDQLANATAKN